MVFAPTTQHQRVGLSKPIIGSENHEHINNLVRAGQSPPGQRIRRAAGS
jgi:hypothetical protein